MLTSVTIIFEQEIVVHTIEEEITQKRRNDTSTISQLDSDLSLRYAGKHPFFSSKTIRESVKSDFVESGELTSSRAFKKKVFLAY